MGGSLGLCLKENKLISCVYGMDLSKENEKIYPAIGSYSWAYKIKDLALCDMILSQLLLILL